MLDSSQNLILINGVNKTAQLDLFQLGANGLYRIKFKNAHKLYSYSSERIVWLKNPEAIDLANCRAFANGKQLTDLAAIFAFHYKNKIYWHVKRANGYEQDFVDDQLCIIRSCLGDRKSKDIFDYLKRVANINDLKNKEGEKILAKQYDGITFIDDKMAIAPYLNPLKRIRHCKADSLIFPFGCNASQKKAVANTFENQISIIQGPPGTGKTQTILNIIANIILQGKTVLVVSNNNSATANVLEKLTKYDMGFIVASLGNSENKKSFIDEQSIYPQKISSWSYEIGDKIRMQHDVAESLVQLDGIFKLQEDLASSRQELQAIKLEWEHFKIGNNISETTYSIKYNIRSSSLMKLWLQYQTYTESDDIISLWAIGRLLNSLRLKWINFIIKHVLRLKSMHNSKSVVYVIIELQALFYTKRIVELEEKIESLQSKLKRQDSNAIFERLVDSSMGVFQSALYDKYSTKIWEKFSSDDLWKRPDDILKQYPVVLSTTFSSRSSLSSKTTYDYIIMDEASQVSIETGALALSCARNAVIVGDTLQLPNVITSEYKQKLDEAVDEFDIPAGYNCSKNSFLQSVCDIVSDAPQVLLREHYRCHPRIINFCNQKFYGGNLLIMTQDNGESDTICAFKTMAGNHVRGHYNQREIDVIQKEVLSVLDDRKDLGIITPYNDQVEQLVHQLPHIESATVHRFQGREKNSIIMSVVDDQITQFSDDPNLLNVAISRAKKKFCLVVSGNTQKIKGNICELISYIEYNNCTVTNSKVCSIFDYLYSQYTEKRMAFIDTHTKISKYDSENLTFALIQKILKNDQRFNCLGVLCHVPLRNIIKETSLLSAEELQYAANYNTHVDFLIISHVSKMPVLVIETDGYSFHKAETEQHRRDLKKNHILALYNIPLLRLSTTGSSEEEKIVAALSRSNSVNSY